MSSESSDPRSEQLNQIIADYLKVVESGEAPDRDELIEQHPDLAEELKSFFADHDQMKVAGEGIEALTLPPRQGHTDAVSIPAGAPLESPTLPPSSPVSDATPPSSGLDDATLPLSQQVSVQPAEVDEPSLFAKGDCHEIQNGQ
jgi:hypothetical protein